MDFKLGVVLGEDGDESGGETQIWGGDGKEEQLSAAGHWILYKINRWMQEDLTTKQSWRHGWTEKSRKQNGAKVEQTKIRECGEQLELKRTSKWVIVAAAEICWLGESVVLGWNGHPPFKLPVTLWQPAKLVFVAEHKKYGKNKTRCRENIMLLLLWVCDSKVASSWSCKIRRSFFIPVSALPVISCTSVNVRNVSKCQKPKLTTKQCSWIRSCPSKTKPERGNGNRFDNK